MCSIFNEMKITKTSLRLLRKFTPTPCMGFFLKANKNKLKKENRKTNHKKTLQMIFN